MLQGYTLTQANAEDVIAKLTVLTDAFIDALAPTMQRHIRRHVSTRRVYKNERAMPITGNLFDVSVRTCHYYSS
jgi:hypothetical protein